MKNLFLSLLLFSLTSCGLFRHVVKDKSSADSTVHRYDVQVAKKDVSTSLEQKLVLKIKDTARTTADSLHSSFSYDPTKKDPVRIQVASGKLQGTLLLRPDLGTGDLFLFKNAEQIPVDSYREESTKATYHGTDTTAHASGENKQVATADQHTDRTVRNNVITGLLIFLFFFLLVLFLVWRKLKKTPAELLDTILDR